MQLPKEFLNRMKAQLGGDYPAYLAAMGQPPVRGLRVNTLKISVEEFTQLAPTCWGLEAGGILPEGLLLLGDAPGIGAHPYHAAGLFYMQEPSTLSAVAALEITPGMRVLDMCAAPGGKSGAIAARLSGGGLLVANEPVPGRAKVLAGNMERLGIRNCAVTCARPDAVAGVLPGYFDAVLVDAPCSGEGMFRKDETAIAEWSKEHVTACAQRQRAILDSAVLALRPGGRLVYSTCTFSEEENEANAEAFARRSGLHLEYMRRLYPHTCRGEGHFVAAFTKAEGSEAANVKEALPLAPCRDAAWLGFAGEYLPANEAKNAVQLEDGRVLLTPPLPAGLSRLHMLKAGVLAGELVKGRFVPAHGLAMSGLMQSTFELSPESEGEGLKTYLAGGTLPGDMADGWYAVTVSGYPLGLGKAAGGVLKNHLPKGLRRQG